VVLCGDGDWLLGGYFSNDRVASEDLIKPKRPSFTDLPKVVDLRQFSVLGIACV
jgi:hypothetical protein